MTAPDPRLMAVADGLCARLRHEIAGLETPAMRGDCLAVMLVSDFEAGADEDEETDDSGTWKQSAVDATNGVIDGIVALCRTAILAALKAEGERGAAEERGRIAWMTEALRQTAALAESPPMPMTGGLSADHIRGMPSRIEGFSSAKLGRWLGWAQAAVVAGGLADLDDMKRLNMLCSAIALPTEETDR